MRVRQRRRMRAAGDQAGDMRHVDHQPGPDRIGDLAEPLPVPDPGIGGAAGQDQLGLVLMRQPLDLLHVEQVVVAAHAVGDHLEPFAGHVDRRAMGQVTARVEVEPHEGVARLQQRQEHRLVHLAAGIRLDVGEIAGKQLLRPLDGEFLGDVDELAAAIVALARIALGIFVGHDRALRLEHGARHDVFRGDQLDLVALAAKLVADRARNVGIGLGKGGGKERRVAVLRCRCGCHCGRSSGADDFFDAWMERAISTLAGRLPRSRREICWPDCARAQRRAANPDIESLVTCTAMAERGSSRTRLCGDAPALRHEQRPPE